MSRVQLVQSLCCFALISYAPLALAGRGLFYSNRLDGRILHQAASLEHQAADEAQKNSTVVSINDASAKPFALGGRWSESPDSANFDKAWIASYLSQTVYRQANETDEAAFERRFVNEMMNIDGAVNCTWWSGSQGGQHVALLETADSFIFVFRGSQDTEDFVADVSSQVQLIANAAESQAVFGGAEGPSVPRGFLTPFKEMWETYLRGQIDYIAQRISAADGSAGTRRRVYTTGHSLGAVMAQYTAAAAQNAGLEVSGVYPFASPYTGGRDAWVYGDGPRSWIARYRDLGLGAKTWLFINPKDLVPQIPIGYWKQVDAASTFDPVNTDPGMCPFRGTSSPPQSQQQGDGATTASSVRPLGDGGVGWTPELIKKEWARLNWEHSVSRYVWTLGHTCASPEDPLWGYLWPSGATPIPPKSPSADVETAVADDAAVIDAGKAGSGPGANGDVARVATDENVIIATGDKAAGPDGLLRAEVSAV